MVNMLAGGIDLTMFRGAPRTADFVACPADVCFLHCGNPSSAPRERCVQPTCMSIADIIALFTGPLCACCREPLTVQTPQIISMNKHNKLEGLS